MSLSDNPLKNLPELTPKALILGIILALVLAAANAFLGLKAGTTISASIPAAIISMGVLRLFKNSNVLENNVVQTAASAGEGLVAGMAYIIPALLVLGYWTDFHYWTCILLAITGGGIGVIYSVPIRRVMLSNPNLPFPEGVAIGNVLKVSSDKGAGLHYLISGGLVGGVVGLAQDGLKLLAGEFVKWGNVGNMIFGYGIGFSPALIAAGYIVGIEVGASLLVGTILAWLVSMPILSHFYNPTGLAAADFVGQIGRTQLRYIGLGTMLLGGLVTIISLFKPLVKGFHDVIQERKRNVASSVGVVRTERDLSFRHMSWSLVLFIIIDFFVLRHELVKSFSLSAWHTGLIIVVLLIFILLACFVFSCLCAYFSGLVGATNNPGSAMVLTTVILCSFLMIVCLGAHLGSVNIAAASLVIIASTIVSNSAVITCETIQDLKAGQMVGATPWKQQFMMMLGAMVSALVVPAVLKLLFNAYGMAGVYPHPGMDPNQMLSAPQSAMMAIVVKAVFDHHLPWNLLGAGFAIAIICMIVNVFLRKRKLGLIIMGVGLGLYIPLSSMTPMVLGAFIAYFVKRKNKQLVRAKGGKDEALSGRQQRILMLACGMVAGCALMGVILAVPFAISQSTDVLAVVSSHFMPTAEVLSLIVTVGIVVWMYRVGTRN